MSSPQGAFIRKLDDSSRFTMPEALLKMYPSTLILTIGFDNTIRAYAPKQWDEFDGELNDLNPNDPDEMDLLRLFRGNAKEVELDGSHRLRLTEPLTSWAGIDGESRDVRVYDAGPYLEIWQAERWSQFMTERSAGLKDAARRVFGKRQRDGEEATNDGDAPPAGTA